MAELNLRTVLEKSLAQDRDDQIRAIQFLEGAAKSDLAGFLTNLSEILANVQENAFIRQAAGLQLKNVVSAKGAELKADYVERWLAVPQETRQRIKINVLGSLGTETARPSIAAQCVAAIAFAEFANNGWPECVPHLTVSVTSAESSETLKAACLEAMGYMCQDLNPKVLGSHCNAILTAIVHGMRKDEPSNYVRMVATDAMCNSLEFTKNNFENEQERNVIMQVVCEATQSSDAQIKVLALQCLVKIMTLYYDHMELYMKAALFAITLEAMKSDNDDVVLQGIEFWSNVCDEEAMLNMELMEATGKGLTPAHLSRNYAKEALDYIVPILLEIMTRQEETDDDEEWVPSKAAGVCIMLLAQCVGDQVVSRALPFVAENVNHPDWRHRDAALMTFGSILDGPDHENLTLLVREGLMVVLSAFNDSHTTVRDTAAWAIGRMCEFCGDIVCQREFLQSMLPTLFSGLSQEPRVASNICWALSSLASAVTNATIDMQGNVDTPNTCGMSFCFESLINELFKVTDRADAHQSNLRIAAYEALMELIKMSPKDCYPVVQNLVPTVLRRLEALIRTDSTAAGATAGGAGEQYHVHDVQALLCATLQALIRRTTRADLVQLGDSIVTVLLQIIMTSISRNSSVVEEALTACATFAEAVGKDFEKYFAALHPFLNFALSSIPDTQLCTAAVGMVDDLTRALERSILPHMEDFMTLMMNIIRSPESDKNLKCLVMTVFGDMALATEAEFAPYLNTVLEAIVQALATQVDESDFDQVEFVNYLRQCCLEAFTSILQGMRTAPEANSMLREYGKRVVEFIGRFASDEECNEDVLLAGAGVVGDLTMIFEREIVSIVSKPEISLMLRKGRRLKSSKAVAVLDWTMKKLSKHMTIK